jgi:hypothetical protein
VRARTAGPLGVAGAVLAVLVAATLLAGAAASPASAQTSSPSGSPSPAPSVSPGGSPGTGSPGTGSPGTGSPGAGSPGTVPTFQQPPPPTQAPTNTPFPTNTPTTVPSRTPTRTPTPVPPATPTDTPITYPTSTATAVLTPPPTSTPSTPPVPLEAGVQPVGSASAGAIAPTGGQLVTGDGVLTVVALGDPKRPPLTLVYQPVDARTLPGAQSGLSLGFAAFQLSALDPSTNALVHDLAVPLQLVIRPGASDVALALGRLDRLVPSYWNGSTWSALPCTVDVATGVLNCAVTHLSLFVPVVPLPLNPFVDTLDAPLANGHFYTQGNGYGGAGGLGYSVQDDDEAPLWSEYQRQGGPDRWGYPISQRFLYHGLITQAFQQGALQWSGDAGGAVPVDVLDELHAHGSDDWLDRVQQIPPAPAGGPSDAGILAPFPAILDAYATDPERFGLPMVVKEYGQLLSARFQRGVLQQWTVDQPSAPAGTVVAPNAGDIAKAAGLWPLDATTPAPPPS